MSTLTLWYWVRHYPLSQILDIDVLPDTTVRDLCKSLVQLLQHQVPPGALQVPPCAVRVYKVPENHPVSIDREYDVILGRLCMSDLGLPLRLTHRVASIFTTLPKENHLHFIVDPTTSTSLNISYWIRGAGPECSFPITLPNSACLGVLRIKAQELWPLLFKDVPTSDMELYKISPRDEDELGEILDRKEEGEPIPADQDVETAFKDIPFSSRVLRVVVEAVRQTRAPPSSRYITGEGDTVQAARQRFLDHRKPQKPSDTAAPPSFSCYQGVEDQAIPCGRPRSIVDCVPLTLLHPAFGQFIQDVRSIQTTRDDHQFTLELANAMSDQYKAEAERVDKIHGVFKSYSIHLTRTKASVSETYGDISINGHRYVIVELRNETGGCLEEPYLQTISHYLESTRPTAAMMYHSPLPCLLLAIFGPYIVFACAAWNRRPTVELLSMPIAFNVPLYDAENLYLLARYMAAFRRATETLKKYYDTLREPTLRSAPASQLFPYPTIYTSLVTNTEKNIIYRKQQPDKQVFFGLESSGDVDSEGSPAGDRICIKFARRYSLEAHQYCVTLGFAPTLRGSQEMPGGWFMVVMDDLSGEYESMFDRPVSGSIKPLIAEKLTQFHEAGFVHGDIRDANIMVSKSDKTKFKLIDFDWAGKVADEPKYPPLVNKEIWRPTEVIDGERILSAHDNAMLSRIYCADD